MGITFTRLGKIVSVSEAEPLPVSTMGYTPIVLLVQETNVQAVANRDLKGSTNVEEPTLDNCFPYSKLIWIYHRVSGDSTTYRVLARVKGTDGQPLGPGWETLENGTLPGNANTYTRIEIPFFDYGHYDQYRIEVRLSSGSPYTLKSKIIGIR